MSARIISMRASLRQKLEDLGTPGDWSHITTQIGMFSYTGLTQEMCVFLKQEKHLYLLKSGRISMCGVSFVELLIDDIKIDNLSGNFLEC